MDLARILDELDAEQIVSYEGYEYKIAAGKSGLQINVKTCPHCGRNDYKVYLNAENGLGNCFGCSKGFNKYNFIKSARGFKQHNEVIGYITNIALTVSYRPKVAPVSYKLNKDWVLPLNSKILLDEDLPQYLLERKVNAKICKRFDLRTCQNGFYRYEDWFERTKFVDFSNRIIIPIFDIEGNLVTFQGRDITGKSEKKYLFPNMLPGTARFIYNSHYALKNKAKKVVLSEGVFDVYAVTEALESDVGYKDYAACGTFGKHLSIAVKNTVTDDQLSDLMKLSQGGVDEFIILWDGERLAIAAAMLAAFELINYGLNATVARLPMTGLDPAESDKATILGAIDNRIRPNQFDLLRMKLEQ